MDVLTASNVISWPKTFYPWFDVCHILLCVLTVRKEAGKQFAHDHPVATWVSCIISSFAGSLLANPLLGKPMFGAFSDEYLVLIATAIFLAVFYSPGDIVYKLVKIKPVYLVVCVVKEAYRAKKIYAGLNDGAKAFPNSPHFIPIIVAVLKGNGSAFMAPFARAVRGSWKLEATELMRPSVTTKECILGAVLISVLGTPDLIFLSLVGLFISIKLGSVFETPVDPFQPVGAILGGVVEAMSPAEAESTKKKSQ